MELKVRLEETQIPFNPKSNRRRAAQIDDIRVEILSPNGKVGQTITFEQQETTEVKNRVRVAWASFDKQREELTTRSYLLRHRLRVLDAVITPSMLYGSGTWTLTLEHEKMIRSTQRKMPRLIVQTRGKNTSIGHDQDSSVSLESEEARDETEEEDWIDYFKRSAREAEEKM